MKCRYQRASANHYKTKPSNERNRTTRQSNRKEWRGIAQKNGIKAATATATMAITESTYMLQMLPFLALIPSYL
jgi:hypothetical protein